MEEELSPTWLDETFVKHVLRSVEGITEDQRITPSKWKCSHAVPPGTNYLSLLYRLCIDYTVDNQSRCISLIVKTPLEKGKMKDFIERVDGYGRELRMYRIVLPKMYEIVGNFQALTARSYDCLLQNSLVLEDLGEQGYKMSDRLKQLDADHCKLFLMSIAKFHGLSVALKQREPDIIESVRKRLYFDIDDTEEDRKKLKHFTTANLSTLLKTVESIGLERYAEMIRGQIDSFYETMERIFKPSGELRVLNHGDCWTANALFKYSDSGEVKDVKLVDFQIIRFGTYALDVVTFWWTSACQSVRENLQEELFEVYRITLNQTLQDAQMSERVSKEEFDNEIRRFSPYALYACASILTVAMADPEDLQKYDVNVEEKTNDNSEFSKYFQSKYYRAILPDLLCQLERFGAFS